MRRAAWVLAGVLLFSAGHARAAEERPPLSTLAAIPVQSHGRLMPLDTFARLTLVELSGRARLGRESAITWMARLLFDPATTAEDRVFLVDHPDTLAALGLPGDRRGRYSYTDLAPGLDRLAALARAADPAAGGSDLVAADLARLSAAVTLYRDLSVALADPEGTSASILALTGQGWASPLRIIPGDERGTWKSALTAALDGGDGATAAATLRVAGGAWRAGDWRAAREALERMRTEVATLAATEGTMPAASLEVAYNRAHLFLLSALLALAAVAAQVVLRAANREGTLAAGVLVAAFVVHTVGIALRIVITGRPPVTSLYTSFLFVAWVVLALGVYLRLARGEDAGIWIGALGASLLALISSRFAAEGDQLGVLQAVLDTNFWLGTHVVTITLGYGGCLVAGIGGHVYLLRRILRPWEEQSHARLYRLIYGTLVFALGLAFLGTVLGGIWADQSWGRFWGWDPKENGALLIVIWIALLLHARLARMIDHRGIAAGSVLLVVVLLFSWLGVNLMGVGLHAYGWTNGAGFTALGVAAFELLFVAVAAPLAGRAVPGSPARVGVRVRRIRRETPDTVTLDLVPRKALPVTPGAFVTLFAPIEGVTHRRAYSFSSGAGPDGVFSISVRRVEGGLVSGWIHACVRPGQRLWVAGPAGSFGLDGEAREPDGPGPVFVAAGSGVAPLAPMAETYFREGGRRLLVILGSRNREHILFRERFDRLAAEHPGLTIRHVLAEPEAGWTGDTGRISGEMVRRAAGQIRGRSWYLCGPVVMVDQLEADLRAAGVEPGAIRVERFTTTGAQSARSAGVEATVRLRKSGRSVVVRRGQSILEAALASGVRVPHSCVAGRCRDCAATLVRGQVHMEEPNVLSPAERERGVILVCAAYPTTDAEVDL